MANNCTIINAFKNKGLSPLEIAERYNLEVKQVVYIIKKHFNNEKNKNDTISLRYEKKLKFKKEFIKLHREHHFYDSLNILEHRFEQLFQKNKNLN
jgi:hypothetical protein